MYSLRRRTLTSAIIPAILLSLQIPNIISYTTSGVDWLMPTLMALLDIALIYILSVIFFSVETLVRIYVTDRENPWSVEQRAKLKQKDIRASVRSLIQSDMNYPTGRITHSVIFQIMLCFLVFFAVTSSPTVIGSGLALSILLQTLVDQALLLNSKQDLSSWFWQINNSFSRTIHTVYFAVIAIIFLVCLAFAVQ
jgi:hypothetical protein